MIGRRRLLVTAGAAIAATKIHAQPFTSPLLGGPRTPLTYPGGLPGFDPTFLPLPTPPSSPALPVILSCVSLGGRFVSFSPTLQTATAVGATTSGIDGVIGPFQNGFASTIYESFTEPNNAVDNTTGITAGAILTPTVVPTEGIIVGNNTAFAGAQHFELRSDVGWSFTNNGSGGAFSSSLIPTANVPYFAAASIRPNQQFWVELNLSNGKLRTATTTNASTIAGAGTGTWAVGGVSIASSSSQAKIAAAYFAVNQFLNLQQLLAWTANPWVAWYPRQQYEED